MSNTHNDKILEDLYEQGLDMGLSADAAMDFAQDAFERCECGEHMEEIWENTGWDGVAGPRHDECYLRCPKCK
jgi:hypothetical protein